MNNRRVQKGKVSWYCYYGGGKGGGMVVTFKRHETYASMSLHASTKYERFYT